MTGVATVEARATDADLFRSLFSRLPAPVAVVTTLAGPDEPRGATVSSLTSVSLEPLTVLVCLARESRTLHALRAHGRFGVNLLAGHAAGTAASFARRDRVQDRFAGVAYHLTEGVPVLDSVAAWLTCRVVRTLPVGDHDVVFGEVDGMGTGEAAPLVWCDRRYHALALS